MTNNLKDSIIEYCSMLPYLNEGSNPNDDKRLYTISYFLARDGGSIDKFFFKEQLQKNKKLKLNSDFDDFVCKRIEIIDHARYIFERTKHLVFRN